MSDLMISPMLAPSPIVYKPKVTQVVDSVGGLYQAKLPDSSETDVSTGWMYSRRGLNIDSEVPKGVVYLKDTNGDYFSLNQDNVSFVAAGKDLNLFVFSGDGTAQKYSFNASTGQLNSADPELLSATAFTREEVLARRDLDGDGSIGANLVRQSSDEIPSGVLDRQGGLFKVSALGEDFFVVGAGLDRARSIDASKNTLLDAEGNVWKPDAEYTSFVAHLNKSREGNTWSVFATNASGEVSEYKFDAELKLTQTNLLSAQDLAAAEKRTLRDINKDNIFGAEVTGNIDEKTGLFKGSLLGQEFYLVGNALKSGTARSPLDLSGALLNSDGSVWALPEGYTGSAMVKNTYAKGETGPEFSVYAYAQLDEETIDQTKILRFDFSSETDDGVKTWRMTLDSEKGLEVTESELAAAEAKAKRDINGDGIFGVAIRSAVDTVGGLFTAQAMGNEYLVVGRSLTSSEKKPLDLSTALLTTDGQAWKPDSVDTLAGNVRVVKLNADAGYEVFVKENGGTFAKYAFGNDFKLTDDRQELTLEELATAEATFKRDLNGDSAFGAKVTALVDARGGLYQAEFESEQGVYLLSAKKLSMGSKVANNGVDLSLALKVDNEYWRPDDGYQVLSSYAKDDGSSVVIARNGDLYRQYTFDAQNKLVDDPEKTGDLTPTQLFATERSLNRDLNGDRTVGIRASTTVDRVGGLHQVTVSGQTFLTAAAKRSDVVDLSTALLNTDGSAWGLPDGESIVAFHEDTIVDQTTGFSLYTSKTVGGSTVFTQHSFDANFKLLADPLENKKVLSLAQLADEEVRTRRDLNNDRSVGALVSPVIDRVSNLYSATIGGETFTFVSTGVPNRGTGLTDKFFLDQDGRDPWKANAGETVRAMVASDDGFEVFASNVDGNVFKYSFNSDKVFQERELLTAEQLADIEKNVVGRDLNRDSAVGLKVTGTVDRIGGLYSAQILGQNFFVVGESGSPLRTGTTASTGIDLSKVLLGANGAAWQKPEGFEIGGLIRNSDTNSFDVYTYKKVGGEVDEVRVHSWDQTSFDYLGDSAADLVSLVNVEAQARRDVSGDGVVGFRVVAPTLNFTGVTEARVAGSITFLLSGSNLRNGTPTNPLTMQNALLNFDGSAPWRVDAGFSVTAVDETDTDAGDGNRYVYASNADGSQVRRYTFNMESGKVQGNGESLTAFQMASIEIARNRNLNNDGGVGVATVAQFPDVRGLLTASIMGSNFLVLNNMPLAGRGIDLTSALLNTDGSAWESPEDFAIKGVYSYTEEGEEFAEVYGFDETDPDAKIFQRFVFLKNEDGAFELTDDQPEAMTGVALALREAEAGRDLNADSAIGFAVNTTALAAQSNGLAITTASVDNIADTPTIYIVSRNIDKLGSAPSLVANSEALFAADGDYWAPTDEAEQILAIVQTEADEVNVFSKNADDEYVQYTFVRSDGKWSLDSSTVSDSEALMSIEAGLRRDINQDGAVGLKVGADGYNIEGLTKATIDDLTFYFAGNFFSGSGIRPLDATVDTTASRLLKNDDDTAWTPPDGESITGWEVLGNTLPDDAPDGAVYMATLSDNSKVYFNDSITLLAGGAAP